MPRLTICLAVLLVGGVFLLAGSVHPNPAVLLSIPAASSPPGLTPSDLEAAPMPDSLAGAGPLALLDQAARRYGPEQLNWLEVTLWQQVGYEDIHYDMTGRYLCAPNLRSRLETQVQTGSVTSRLEVVCDGTRVSERQHIPGQADRIEVTELPRIQNPTDDPAAIAAAREAILQQKCFRGVAPLLLAIRQGLQRSQLQAVKCTDVNGELLEIKGEWVTDPKTQEAVPAEAHFKVQPRECRVYLNAETLWPHRIEWWGSPVPSQPNVLLMQTEYRQPVLNQPLAADRLAREFVTAAASGQPSAPAASPSVP